MARKYRARSCGDDAPVAMFFLLGVSVESTTSTGGGYCVRHIPSYCDDIMAFTHEQLRGKFLIQLSWLCVMRVQ